MVIIAEVHQQPELLKGIAREDIINLKVNMSKLVAHGDMPKKKEQMMKTLLI